MIVVTCPICGGTSSIKPCRKDTYRVCSLRCRGIWYKSLALENKVKLTCPICYKDFHVKKSLEKKRLCCSLRCFYEYKKIYMLGEGNHQYDIKGANNSSWSGGRFISNYGYILVYNPENSRGSDLYVLEHRLVMEKKLGRKLTESEVVHHIDGDKLNNDPDNLSVMSLSEHSSHHVKLQLPNMKRNADTGRFVKG